MTKDSYQVHKISHREEYVMDRAWHIPFLGTLVSFFASSPYRISGLLLVKIMEEFNVNREEASWPVNMISSGYDIGGLVYGLLSQWLSLAQTAVVGALLTSFGVLTSVLVSNIWWMTCTLGMLHGLGSGTMSVCTQVFVSHNFVVYRGIAHGIVSTGPSISALVFPGLLLLLTSAYNFKASVVLLGGVLLNLIPLSALFTHHSATTQFNFSETNSSQNPTPSETASNIEAKQHGTFEKPSSTLELKPRLLRTVAELLRTPMYYVLLVSWLALYLNMDIVLSTIVDFAKDIGVSESKAAALLSYASITDALGRLLIPLVADKKLIRRSTLSAVNFLALALFVAVLASVRSYVILVILTLPMAAGIGCSQAMFGALLADYIGLQRLSAGYGLCSVIGAPILLLKPLFIGYFRDTIGSYVNMFRVLAGLQILNSGLWFGVLFVERKRFTLSLGKETPK